MGRGTKKVGPAGRLGARYGVRVRKRIRDIEVERRKRQPCPRCRQVAVTRTGTGIWVCQHCQATFASGAYLLAIPTTVVRQLPEGLRPPEAETAEEKPKAEPEEAPPAARPRR